MNVKILIIFNFILASGLVLFGCTSSTSSSSNSNIAVEGSWVVNYTWTNQSPGSFTNIFGYNNIVYINGTNVVGNWTENGSSIQWVYTNGTTYSGTFSNSTIDMSGIMFTTNDNNTGIWSAIRLDTP